MSIRASVAITKKAEQDAKAGFEQLHENCIEAFALLGQQESLAEEHKDKVGLMMLMAQSAAAAEQEAWAELLATKGSYSDPAKAAARDKAYGAFSAKMKAKEDLDIAQDIFDQQHQQVESARAAHAAVANKTDAAWEIWKDTEEELAQITAKLAAAEAAEAAEASEAAEAAAAAPAAEAVAAEAAEAARVKAYWEKRRATELEAAKLAERERFNRACGGRNDVWPLLQRNFKKLPKVVPDGAYVCVESKGDKWEGVFRHGGHLYSGPFFEVQGKRYFSPTALCQAHSDRITDRHPRATKPGNGWAHIHLAAKPGNKWGPTIGVAYDSHSW